MCISQVRLSYILLLIINLAIICSLSESCTNKVNISLNNIAYIEINTGTETKLAENTYIKQRKVESSL